MRQQLVLEFEDVYPFGKVEPYNQEDEIIVVKKVSFGSPAQRTTLLNKADFLKMLSSNLNIVALLGYEEGPDSLHLIYEYIPFEFVTLLEKKCEFELSQARCTLAKLTTQLQTLGLKTNIHQGTVGLDVFRRLKYYVSIEDVPDTHFEQQQDHSFSHINQEDGNENSLEDGIIQSIPASRLDSNQNSLDNSEAADNYLLPEQDRELPRLSGLSRQSQSLQRTSASLTRMDDLLQKINVRLQELNDHRRKTTPSRYVSKELALPQNQHFGELSNCTQFRANSSASTQIENPKQFKLDFGRQKIAQSPKTKTPACGTGSRLKYSSSTDNLLGEYTSLKTERKEMLDRIKGMIEKTDSVLENYKSRKLSSMEAVLNL